MYLMRGGTHRTRALKFETRFRTAMCNRFFELWYELKTFVVLPINCHRLYVTMLVPCQKLEAQRMFCVPSPPMSASCFSAFGNNASRFGHLLLETAMTKFMIVLSVCFVKATEYGVAELYMHARHPSLVKCGSLRANKGLLVPHSSKMRASVLNLRLFRLTGVCAVDPMPAILAFARPGEINWTAPDCVGRFLYQFADAAIIFFLELQTKCLKWGLRGYPLPRVVHAKVAPC